MKTKILIILSILFITSIAQAQVTYAKPEEFKILKERTLVVELQIEDYKKIESWTKKKNKAKKPEVAEKYDLMIEEYKQFILDYNKYIKIAVEKVWDLNENIEYKTTAQIKMLKNNNEEYTVLYYSESTSEMSDEFGRAFFPNLSIPTLNYNRIEKSHIKVDYSFFMPNLGDEQNKITEAHLLLSLKLMKNHIQEIENTGKKKYTFKDYAVKIAKQNCPELEGKEVAILGSKVHKKSSFKGIKSNYSHGEILEYSSDEFKESITNENEQILCVFIPHTIAAGSLGPLNTARILFMKCFINVSNGKIHHCSCTMMGEFNDFYLREKEFGKFGNCK